MCATLIKKKKKKKVLALSGFVGNPKVEASISINVKIVVHYFLLFFLQIQTGTSTARIQFFEEL